jgi:hypothetical protein
MDAILGAIAAATPKVQLQNETVSANNGAGQSWAEYIISYDGNVYKNENRSGDTQINAPDWIRPTAKAQNYEVRYTSVAGDTGDISASNPAYPGSEGTWLAMTGTNELYLEVTDTSPSGAVTKTITFTVEVRDAATATTIDTASISLTANQDTL